MMTGEGRQHKNSIFVGDQLEAVCNALRQAVKFRTKLPVLFAIRLDLSFQTGYLVSVRADKKLAFQIVYSRPIAGCKSVVFRKGNATTRLCKFSREKFAG